MWALAWIGRDYALPHAPAGVRSWQITERPCRGVNHEYSNKCSPTMGLLAGGLRYGPSLTVGLSNPSSGWGVRNLECKIPPLKESVALGVLYKVEQMRCLFCRVETYGRCFTILAWVGEKTQVSHLCRTLESQS